MTPHATRTAIAAAVLGVLLALGTGAGTGSAEETGPNAWCYRPFVIWQPVLTEAYVPSIHCEERELPAGDTGAQWSSERLAELAVAPDGWSLPARSVRSTRWGWVHEYDASSGLTYVYGEMSRVRDQSGSTSAEVYLSVVCDVAGKLHASIVSDVAPVDSAHSVVWWTDYGRYRHAERWDAEEIADEPDLFRAWAESPNQLWAAIRASSRLHVLIFGDRAWRSAEAHVLRINQLDVVEMLDYCGQDDRAEDAAGR